MLTKGLESGRQDRAVSGRAKCDSFRERVIDPRWLGFTPTATYLKIF